MYKWGYQWIPGELQSRLFHGVKQESKYPAIEGDYYVDYNNKWSSSDFVCCNTTHLEWWDVEQNPGPMTRSRNVSNAELLEKMENRFKSLDIQLDRFDMGISSIIADVIKVKSRLNDLESKVNNTSEDRDKVDNKLADIAGKMTDNMTKSRVVEDKLGS